MNDQRFDELLDAWLAGELASPELAELQAALAGPERHQRFLTRCQLEGALRRSGAAAPPQHARPALTMPVAGALLAAAAITLLLLPGRPATHEPTLSPARTVSVHVADDDGSWAVATQEADGALALSFIPILTTDR